MNILILAHRFDDTALGVYTELVRRRGPGKVILASSEELTLAPYWRHSLDSEGGASTRVRLASGTVLDSDGIGLVFNRLRFPEMPHFQRSAPADKTYAAMEMHALLLSWLASLPCPVLNRASSQGLSGPERSRVEWIALALEAGLPAQPLRMSTEGTPGGERGGVTSPEAPGSLPAPRATAGRAAAWAPGVRTQESRDIFIIGEEILGPVPDGYRDPLGRLRALSGCELLKVTFTAGGEANPVWGASTVDPFFEVTDRRFLAKVADLLESREKRE